MIFRTQDEIQRRLNKMEPPTPSFLENRKMSALSIDEELRSIAFRSGYEQAVKEMKEYFGIKGNGIHAR